MGGHRPSSPGGTSNAMPWSVVSTASNATAPWPPVSTNSPRVTEPPCTSPRSTSRYDRLRHRPLVAPGAPRTPPTSPQRRRADRVRPHREVRSSRTRSTNRYPNRSAAPSGALSHRLSGIAGGIDQQPVPNFGHHGERRPARDPLDVTPRSRSRATRTIIAEFTGYGLAQLGQATCSYGVQDADSGGWRGR